MDENLHSSVLGTMEYWDDAYQKELQNFKSHGDVGEIWFGEMISNKIVQWITGNTSIKKDDNIIDIGCGNGMLLVDLSRKGYTALHGVDYSKNAISLALDIARKENSNIKFSVNNVLEDLMPSIYHLALDKGTFDAISLDPEDSASKRQKYIKNVWNILRKDGMFLITSCNWTEEELKRHFNSCFSYMETLPTPSFSFGGQKGNTVTSVVFRKIINS